MWIRSQGFHAPKRGNVESEYEDAYFPERPCRSQLSEFHCAIADGASESAFSREWARLLVRGYYRQRMSLARLQRLWMRNVTRRPVPWYLEAKIQRGAHATFLGLSLEDDGASDDGGGAWRIAAVGDSCMFHVRGGELLTVAPVTKSDEFDNHPHLISTDVASSFGLDRSRTKVASGHWRSDDEFYLLTDALAQWALVMHEAERPAWGLLRRLVKKDERRAGAGQRLFEKLVSKLRESGALRNDDTTLLRVEVL